MNLDDLERLRLLDAHNMLQEIDHLPQQLQTAWKLGQTADLPADIEISRVLVAGMGGSAIGADLLAAYIAPLCPVPVFVHREYGLPAWASGRETLVIASSHSGNTEETLDAFEIALERGCTLLALCAGGELEQRAHIAHVPIWKFEHAGQPRAAVGYSFGLLLALFSRLDLIPNPQAELDEAIESMLGSQESWRAEVPVVKNPAKRLAGQLIGRWVNVYGAGILAPVARRWKTQINELAKAGAGFEILPEADHNALAGLENPEMLSQTITLFLQAGADHPRNRLRVHLTRQAFLVAGLNQDMVEAQGRSPLAQMWTTLLLGDYIAFYLAIAYGVDPTPVEALQAFKAALRSAA
ncbi:MAG: bifunctional phosphoglucose/phosphomannose isomerase [Anaerolineales bacterium]|nr:bifunctional phosphoglucose/phosphomannose isomerase [Anaerolineales bacterium]MCX7609476.1 bifunctional phosphoglucose/phosphomannose isomerase [Anaerolineales bacterium]MDW8226236.1 bifunctional phosphoglucose/phosphomannose isomerase [Anaerolineales bacterium]